MGGGGNWIQLFPSLSTYCTVWIWTGFKYPSPLFKSWLDSNCVPCTEAGKLLDSNTPPPLFKSRPRGVGGNIVHYLLVLAKYWIQLPSPPPLFESRFTQIYTMVIALSTLCIEQAHAARLKTKLFFLSGLCTPPSCHARISGFADQMKNDQSWQLPSPRKYVNKMILVVRRPVRESRFSGLHGREAGIYMFHGFPGGGVSTSPFSTGLCSPNFDQGGVTPSVSALLLVCKSSFDSCEATVGSHPPILVSCGTGRYARRSWNNETSWLSIPPDQTRIQECGAVCNRGTLNVRNLACKKDTFAETTKTWMKKRKRHWHLLIPWGRGNRGTSSDVSCRPDRCTRNPSRGCDPVHKRRLSQ